MGCWAVGMCAAAWHETHTLPATDECAITAAAAAAAALEQQEFVDMNPRTAPSGGVKQTTYAAWFSRPGWALARSWDEFDSLPR